MSRVTNARRSTRRHWLLPIVAAALLHAVPAAATTYTVSNTNDSGPGSLRQAILDANAHMGTDTIWLIIGSGSQTITPLTQLPDVTDPVLIDGWVQPGFAGTPLIRIDGNNFSGTESGLRIYAGPTTLRGMIFTRFYTGVSVGGGDGITFRGCYFGTTGSAAGIGNHTGMRLVQGTNITLGGALAGDGNVISGNDSQGVYVDPTVSGLTLKGNRIGTNAAGTAALGNGSMGFRSFASNVTIGGATAAERNLFSGNGNDGLIIESVSTGVVIRGNYFGLDAGGTLDLGNAGTGITDYGAGTIIGGTNAGEGNVASGNGYYGIGLGGQNTSVLGNRIGTNAAGTAAIGNGVGGVFVTGVNVTVGGTTAAARNLISGNTGGAMGIDGAADGVYVYGNYMGTDVTGSAKLANAGGGIGTYGTNVSIGGTAVGSGNVISGNGDNGIYIGGGSNLAIRRNYIGTDATGQAALGNAGYAIRADGAPGTLIGTPGNGNVISANNRGVVLGYGASGYTIRGNIIGLNKDATAPLGNKEYGLELDTADNIVGGTTLGAFNIIASNTLYGVVLSGPDATNNKLENNYIGTNPALATGLGNWFGVVFYGASGNTIGGTANGTGNYIADSVNSGIYGWFGARNRFLRNNIWGNGGPGIEVDPRGPQPNDALDEDHGPNEGQNFPTVTSATADATSVTVGGFLDSLPSAQFRVEYFVSTNCETSGFGEGEHYIGFQNVTTGADGKATLGANFVTTYLSGFVTATATDPDGNTSEFSPCMAIGVPGPGEFNIVGNLAYEDYGSFEFVVTRALGFSGSVSVRVKTSDLTATTPGDYGAIDKVLTFADGESVKKLSIPLVLDDVPEGTQKFNIALSEATGGAALGPQSSVDVTLFDHDPNYPFWLLDDVGVAPPPSGQKVVNVGVRLSAAAVAPITLTWNTADGSAHAGQDYLAANGQVQFAVGEKAKVVPVTITANGPLPADRTFYLRINGAIGQVIAADTEAEITIFGGDRIFANSFD